MNCQDVRLLLAFERKCEELDSAEREAMRQHLDQCGDCKDLCDAERRADETLGQLVRDVPVPAELKQKLLKRLAADRPGVPWKSLAAAAAVLIALTAGVTWHVLQPEEISINDLSAECERGAGWEIAQVQEYFAARGLPFAAPNDFDFRYLRHIEIVAFQKRNVAKLTFRIDSIKADVLILPHRYFRVDHSEYDGAGIRIIDYDHFTCVIFHQGDLQLLKKKVDVPAT